ncbi:MAG: HAD hydrolase family protein, partial [Acidimicrobiales bacterium]
QATWHLASAAGLGPLGVCSNGAAIVDVDAGRVLEVNAFAGEVARSLVATIRHVEPAIRFAVDNLDCFCRERNFFEVPVDWQERLDEVDDIDSALGPGCVKLIARLPGLGAAELIERLEREVGAEGVVTTSGLDWVDIGAPGISKAFAMERVCDRLGVEVSEVIAIGDNHNDLSILGWAGTAMAPANAISDVLAMVERVLPSNDQDGVAALLEELAAARAGLPQPGGSLPR